jgi:hypothetical protein
MALEIPEFAGTAWDEITLGGVHFGGLAAVSGDAFKRKIDARRAAGQDGARIVDRGYDLVDLTITLTAWEPEHAAQLQRLVALLAPRGTRGRGLAVEVQHPALAFAGISRIYVTGASLPSPSGGTLTWTIKASEFRDPPPARQGRAATRTAQAAPQTSTATDLDPRLQQVIAQNPIPAPSQAGAAAPPARGG